MWLLPDPLRIDETHRLETAHAAHAEREQLGTLELHRHPLRNAVVLAACAADVNVVMLIDPLGDVDRPREALQAPAIDGLVRQDGRAT